MPSYKSLSVLLFLSLLTFACNEVVMLVRPVGSKPNQACLLKTANHGHGIIYNLNYDAQKLITTIAGFSDFDKISYENNLPAKAENTKDNSYYITFQYDTKGSLSHINFVGKDSEGKNFEYKSNVYVNAQNQAERINLNLPFFNAALETSISYDKNGNITKISILANGQQKPLLENLSFDNNNSPYLDTTLSNIMLYFVIFSASIGAENTTYFINKNNVTAARIYSSSGNIDYTYQYEYNKVKFPTKTSIIRKQNGKEDKYQEFFSYECE